MVEVDEEVHPGEELPGIHRTELRDVPGLGDVIQHGLQSGRSPEHAYQCSTIERIDGG